MAANTEATVVTAEASLLSQLLYKGKLEVPWHQRKYDWSRENVSDLLIDLDEAFRENRGSYFLGAIVLVEKSDQSWKSMTGSNELSPILSYVPVSRGCLPTESILSERV